MVTKRQVQRWARDEWARLEEEKIQIAQAACKHMRSGHLRPNTNIVVCDDCQKALHGNDLDSYSGSPSPIEQGAIARAQVR